MRLFKATRNKWNFKDIKKLLRFFGEWHNDHEITRTNGWERFIQIEEEPHQRKL
jgi:hypothetical protein